MRSPVLIIDDGQRVISANPGAAALLGSSSADELLGRPLAELFRPQDVPRVLQACRDGDPRVVEVLVRDGGLCEHAVCLTVERGDDDARVRVSLRAVESQCPLKVQLDAADARFTDLMEHLQVGVLVQGTATEMLLWNSKALELLGMTEDQLLGRTSFDPRWNVIHEDGSDFPADTHPSVRALETGAPVDDVVMGVFRPEVGDRVWLLVNAVPRRDDVGEVVDVVVTFSDITERKRLVERVSAAQRHALVSRLAGSIAHDFNNLMSVVGLLAEIHQEDPDRSAVDAAFQEIVDITRRGAALTRRLLNLSGKDATQVEPLVVDEALMIAATIVERALGDSVELDLDLGAPGVAVMMDGSRFEHAVLNLAINARDAMPGGGRFTLRTCRSDGDKRVIIEAADTGFGLPEGVGEQVFEPFFTTKDADRGTGLGLPSVRDFCHQAGGRISFVSSRSGTTFRLELPYASAEFRRVDTEAVPSVHPPAGARVLLVDNDPGIRRILDKALRRAGYQVLVAPGGAEGLRILEQQPIDVLVTDVVMPGLDGVGLSERARALNPKLSVVYISGYVGGHAEELAHRMPNTGFVAKPFEIARLLSVVERLLQDARGQVA